MQSIPVNLKYPKYFIKIIDEFKQLKEEIFLLANKKKIAIVTNITIAKIYKEKINKLFKNLKLFWLELPDGEQYKNFNSLKIIYNFLLLNHFEREDFLVTLGGGVIGDTGGYAASSYLRGINLIHIPTTLLADVDSSIGGKTGINLPQGKNLIGSFYQPQLVLIYPFFLKTLPQREFVASLAEVIKYGIIKDKNLFLFLENNYKNILKKDLTILTKIIYTCAKVKAQVVEKDEKEKNLRAILNYGHTLAHSLESATHYKKFLHGEAVSLGMNFAAYLSYKLNLFSKENYLRQIKLQKNLQLPLTTSGISLQKVFNLLYYDKKVKDKKLRFVLPLNIGEVKIFDNLEINLIKEGIAKIISAKL